MRRNFTIVLISFVSLLLWHCKKDVAKPESDFHSAFAASETALEDALTISRNFLQSGKLPFSNLNCPVNIDSLADGSIELTFADSCKLGDNRFRSGKLILYPAESGQTRVDMIHYSIFTDSSYALLGTFHYAYDQSFTPYLKINSNSAFHVYRPTGNQEIFSAELQHQREVIEGAATALTRDDVISKTGSGTFTLKDGKQWLMNYSSPATKRLTIGCIDFVTGQAIFSSGRGGSLLFDWGGGTCDNRYSVTLSEQTTIHNIP